MFARTRLTSQQFTRNFQTSSRSMNKIFGTPAEGVYSNLPFKVKNRKIPLSVPFWGILGFFFAFPFLASYWHMKKAGSFDQ
ncbi:cytochrome c oxidase subunit 8, mitochondrial [[Candida] railenensis]|uniref:Cytochrome c oxidase subunit 8, mitochondrial n=1 Tax=[Candida] railenensis TaxID=45579 RepID=A0A9P0QQ33_9ASCO|nr:cytochrome c oxidase subunit 8, mitochondrial [[Candida] railenensis]